MTEAELRAQNERLKELLRLALACEDNATGWREDAEAELAK